MVFYFLIFGCYPQSSAFLSSVALFTLSFSFLSERFFFVHDKAALARSRTGVTGQSLPPKNDFEHARGLRNSAYAVNLTYELDIPTYRHYISREISIEHPPVRGSLRSPNYFRVEICRYKFEVNLR